MACVRGRETTMPRPFRRGRRALRGAVSGVRIVVLARLALVLA